MTADDSHVSMATFCFIGENETVTSFEVYSNQWHKSISSTNWCIFVPKVKFSLFQGIIFYNTNTFLRRLHRLI